MPGSLAAAVRALERGKLVVHPTDTLYALAARADLPSALERVRTAKGRAPEHRLSLTVSSTEELDRWGVLTDAGRAFVREHLPGPWTILAAPTSEARRTFGPEVAGGARIGLRVPDHPIARALARRLGPITATSANRSGRPAARTLDQARRALGRSVAVYLDGPPPPSGRPSSLIDLAGRRPRRVARR